MKSPVGREAFVGQTTNLYAKGEFLNIAKVRRDAKIIELSTYFCHTCYAN
jgi:hypothetical protein